MYICDRELPERLRHVPFKVALNERLDEPDPSGAEEGMRAAASCSPKAHLSETSGQRSGRRVWGCGSLRSEEKDLCESPRIQCNLIGACRKSVDFKPSHLLHPPPLQKGYIVLYSYYDRYTTTDVVTTGDTPTVNIWHAGKEEGT